MTADIILYQAVGASVGEDQRQQSEVARNIIRGCTPLYNKGSPFQNILKNIHIPYFI
jgi:tryptophanyl-tRNA synthetase